MQVLRNQTWTGFQFENKKLQIWSIFYLKRRARRQNPNKSTKVEAFTLTPMKIKYNRLDLQSFSLARISNEMIDASFQDKISDEWSGNIHRA